MLTIPASQLAELVGIANKVTAARSAQPIAESIRLVFNKTEIAIYSTDFETWLSVSTPHFSTAKDTEVAIVPAAPFYSLISKLPNDSDVQLSMKAGNRLTVSSGKSKYNFGSLPDADWPTIPNTDKATVFNFEALALKETLSFVSRSMMQDDDSSQYYLCGVNMLPGDNCTRFRAADGHILSQTSIKVLPGTLIKEGIILPKKTVLLYIDMLDRIDPTRTVKMSVSEGRAKMEFKDEFNFTMTGRLIDGVYPDTDRMIPHDRDHARNGLARQGILNALNRMQIFSEDAKSGVTLLFSKESLELSKNTERGDGAETFDAEKGAMPGKIVFNIRYLQTILSGFRSDSIEVLCKDGEEFGKAGAIFVESGTDIKPGARLSVVMPMRG